MGGRSGVGRICQHGLVMSIGLLRIDEVVRV